MRIHVTLDDIPEFESFQSMWVTLRGMMWSIENSSLAAPLDGDDLSALMVAFESLQGVLHKIVDRETPWLEERRQERANFVWPDHLFGRGPTPSVSAMIQDRIHTDATRGGRSSTPGVHNGGL